MNGRMRRHRADQTAVWTEASCSSGADARDQIYNTGGRYDTREPTTGRDDARDGTIGTLLRDVGLDGSKMIVWGGRGAGGASEVNHRRVRPGCGPWTPTNTENAPSARSSHTASDRSRMIVWVAGVNLASEMMGGLYDPYWTSGRRRISRRSRAEIPSYGRVAGSRMIVWGGIVGNSPSTAEGGTIPRSTMVPTSTSAARRRGATTERCGQGTGWWFGEARSVVV